MGDRPTDLIWVRRRFWCPNCSERHTESHPEISVKLTRCLARQLVRDAQVMTIKAVVDFLRVSPEEMGNLADGTGWELVEVLWEDESLYIGVLQPA
jgi:hypothetical protein